MNMIQANKRIIIAVFVLIIIGAGGAMIASSMWRANQRAAAEARYANQTGAAVRESAKDAIATTGAAHARETDIQNQVERSTDEINAAPAGNSNAAADRAACGLRSYRHTPRCRALLGTVAD